MDTAFLAGEAASPSVGETGTVKAPAPAAPLQEISFGRRTLRITVPVTIAEKGPYDFLVDTGAERSVLSRELAQELALDDGPATRMLDFTGSSIVPTVRVPSLSAGKLMATGIDAPSLAMANLGARGMLGIDALQGHKLVIDFDRKRMLVMPAKRHADGDFVFRAASRDGQLIITKAWFEGKPISVVIDTGSWVSVGNKAMLALASKQPKLIRPISVESVSGRYFHADYVSVDKVKIGGITFNNFALSFADVPPFERLGLRDKPALILGLSSLQLFRRVELDFLNREIAFSMPQQQIDFHILCRRGLACRSIGIGR